MFMLYICIVNYLKNRLVLDSGPVRELTNQEIRGLALNYFAANQSVMVSGLRLHLKYHLPVEYCQPYHPLMAEVNIVRCRRWCWIRTW